jgi:hypothetical protein
VRRHFKVRRGAVILFYGAVMRNVIFVYQDTYEYWG